jgi:CHAT domain-containing protein
VVSSYIPSLSALIKAHENFTPVQKPELRALLFAEPDAPGMSYIPKVKDEVQKVADVITSTSASVINDLYAPTTVGLVLKQAPFAHILHLACHGHQHEDPLKSCFALHDDRLTILALMNLNLPTAMLAYLSACKTAKGAKSQPDQAVHLATSMLFSGFRSVVATMW